MFKNFLKLTLRNLLKNKTYVIINIIGLGLSLSCCIVAYLNYDFGISFDRNHENLEKIYKIQSKKLVDNNTFTYGITPLALNAALENKSPAISMQSKYTSYSLSFLKNDRAVQKNIGCVDKNYLDIFTYPLKYGNKNSIHQKGNIIISIALSDILFGEGVNAVGKLVKVDQNGQEISFAVGGVLEKIPQNTSMQFDGIINFEHYLDFEKTDANNWKNFIAGTFVVIDNPENVKQVESLLQTFVPIQNAARRDWLVNKFYLEPMGNVAFVGRDIRSNWMWSAPHPMMINVPPIMAILMLLIACFNFTNTSIAISSKRLKEIGIRKVMGSNRQQLILQFMGENLMLCFFSLVFSILFSLWLVPAFSSMWQGIDLYFDVSRDIGLVFFLVGLLLFTSIIAGGYPSLYISKYEPVSILKGNMRVGKTNWFSYTLLTTQYAITVIALIASVAFIRNAFYQQNMDLGYKRDAIVYATFDTPEEGRALKNAVSQQAFVNSAVLSKQHISSWSYSRTLKNQDKKVSTDMMDLGMGYIETMGLSVIKGRAFNKQNEENDSRNSVIVNEQLAKTFGWENPIGQRLTVGDSLQLTVIGVIKDFYNNGFWAPIDPIAIRLSTEEQANFLIVGINVKQSKQALASLEDAWAGISPNKPFIGQYQDMVLKESMEVNGNIVIIFSFLGILAVILSAIGLFTLVSLNVLRRVKEIGVRKVLGAGTPHIVTIMSKVFFIVLGISTVIGGLAAFFAIDIILSGIFTFYQSIDIITVLLPVIVIVAISLGISSFRILAAVQKNPVESLKYE